MKHPLRTLAVGTVLAVTGVAFTAGDEKSRPECRQEKRDTKQDGRRS